MALLIAGLALGGPLVGMMLVSLGGHSYMHLLPEYAPLPLSLAILSVGGTAVGLALLPSFFFGAVCGYVLPNFWPYLAASSGLALSFESRNSPSTELIAESSADASAVNLARTDGVLHKVSLNY